MAESIAVKCPECAKFMNVPAALAGKKIRCKGCEATVQVAVAKPKAATKPKAKEPEVFKLKDEEPAKPEPKPKDDFDDDANPYGLIADDSHIVRCAFCAKELDPPDARICKNCGYDMQERRRYETKAVYESTIGDYLKHHIITILAAFTIIAAIALDVYCLVNLNDWFNGSIFEMDDKDIATGRKKYWVGPDLAKVWITLFLIFTCYYAGRFIYRMCSKNFHPIETLLKE